MNPILHDYNQRSQQEYRPHMYRGYLYRCPVTGTSDSKRWPSWSCDKIDHQKWCLHTGPFMNLSLIILVTLILFSIWSSPPNWGVDTSSQYPKMWSYAQVAVHHQTEFHKCHCRYEYWVIAPLEKNVRLYSNRKSQFDTHFKHSWHWCHQIWKGKGSIERDLGGSMNYYEVRLITQET